MCCYCCVFLDISILSQRDARLEINGFCRAWTIDDVYMPWQCARRIPAVFARARGEREREMGFAELFVAGENSLRWERELN